MSTHSEPGIGRAPTRFGDPLATSALRRDRVLRMPGTSENIHRLAHVGPRGPHQSVRRDRDVRVIPDETGVVVTRDREVGEPPRVGCDARARVQTLRREARRREVARSGQRVAVDARLTAGRGPRPIDETDAKVITAYLIKNYGG